MNKKLLKTYKNKYASLTIQKRAHQITLDDVDQKSNYQYRFSYLGSQPEPYMIQMIQNNKTLVSTCSCPYDFGGLCKHEVAAIDYILESQQVTGQKTKKKCSKP